MAIKIPEKSTENIETKGIAQEIENMKIMATTQRRRDARNWHDNNFFDDGFHYRYLSRTTGRIIDLSERATLYAPKRAIPKTSRQLRGMANLILSSDWVPKVKPGKVSPYSFEGGMQSPEFMAASGQAKNVAKRTGHWLEEEWKKQEIDIKMAFMLLLAMKHSVSYMQTWADPVEEKIRTQVYDAFDIYLASNYTSIYDSPFIIKVIPKTVREIKANENFDKDQLDKITPDNRYASDEIKEAYLSSKFGKLGKPSDSAATLLQHEAFIKEYLGSKNRDKVRESDKKNKTNILRDKKDGDPIIRHVFSAGKVWLLDEYVDLEQYPFVDLRLEPGRIYQTPIMNRFVSANKSLDQIVSRLERFFHTMHVGVWLKRRGENFKISNVAGGLQAEYEGTPPAQMPLASPSGAIFNFMSFLTGLIEEQGVSTSALAKIPKGVRAWGAIESLKASEFANLYIPIKMVKRAIKKISKQMFEIADKHFVSPQTVTRLEKGSPDYFDIIGQGGLEARKGANIEAPAGVVPISKDYEVDVEIESGLGYTEEGKKGRMMDLAKFMLSMAEAGYLTPAAVKLCIERLMEIFKFGPAAEMMDALEGLEDQQEMTDDQLEKLKVAILETFKDLKPAREEEQKTAFLEVIKDLQKAGAQASKEEPKKSKEVQRSETVETGKDGQKTKREVKTIEKAGG